MWRLYQEYGLRYFFGADDNFFNNKSPHPGHHRDAGHARNSMALPLRRKARWYTEVTVHDTLQMKEHLAAVRDAGCRALWLGVEDMTATLVKKGQSVRQDHRSVSAAAPGRHLPHADDDAPRLPAAVFAGAATTACSTRSGLLRKAGAVSLQVLMITPSAGTKLYEKTFADGQVMASAGGRRVEPYMYDGNYVVASHHSSALAEQLNLLLAYLYFYNPTVVRAAPAPHRDARGLQARRHAARRHAGPGPDDPAHVTWVLRLMFGKIVRQAGPPVSAIQLRRLESMPAAEVPVAIGISSRGTVLPDKIDVMAQ